MKQRSLIVLALALASAFGLYGQFSTTAARITRGAGAPSAGSCNAAASVGKVYYRTDAAASASSFYGCSKTGASTYAWEAVVGSAVTGLIDSSGNISTPGGLSVGVGGSAAGYAQFAQGTAPGLGTTAITLHAPSSVTSYRVIFPTAAATGLRFWTNAANVVTESIVTNDTTTTHALFATAGAPAFRALAGSDLPTTWGGLDITNTGAGGGLALGGNGLVSAGIITGNADIVANAKLRAATALWGTSASPSVNATSCTGATIGSSATNTLGTITGLPTGVCSVVVTFNGVTATHGWVCAVSNQTTANLFRQSANSTTTVTFAGTSVSGDVLAYGPCAAY